MIAKFVDNLVGVFSPLAGLKRRHAREVYRATLRHAEDVKRAYEAAKTDRLNANWRTPNSSADMELLSDADKVRARARDLVRNNAYARGILRAAVRNIVGPGIRPQCRTELSEGRPNENYIKAVESLWSRWQMQADVTGRLSFYEIQQLVVSERWEAGELLIRMVEVDDPKRPLPFALELIEADRFAPDARFPMNRTDGGNEVRRGVELDSFGRPVAYWLYPYHPNDINGLYAEPKRYPASEFIHLFRSTRIGQTRGISEFAPVVRWVKNLDRYMDNELASSAVASCFSVAIKTLSAGADGGIAGPSSQDSQDENSNSFEYIEPGLVARLFPDEEVQVINPSRGQSEASSWLMLMLRSIGVGTGLSYERLTRDYSQTNYSSNRASDLEDRREFRTEQQWLIKSLCVPVWIRFLSSAVFQEKDGFPDAREFLASFENWTRHDWQPPGWEWVDPQKEVTAKSMAVEKNMTTLASVCGETGNDWRDVLRQRAVENAFAKELGATFDEVEDSQYLDEEDGDATGEETAQDGRDEPAASAV